MNLVPIALGAGIRLFANLDDLQLDLECTASSNPTASPTSPTAS
jgi:hypothetical protein